MTRTRLALILAAFALTGLAVWQFAGSGKTSNKSTEQSGQRGGRRFGGDAPPSVLVASPRTADVPVLLDAVGTAAAAKTVTVRAQVEGRLVEVSFREGQDVKAGDVLARIDPIIYKAQLDQVVAKKAQDEAQLANARLDLARYEKLAKDRSASVQQVDTQRALVAQLEAQVKLDQAAIDNARALYGYTTIVSPIAGRAGIRAVDEGNLVRASDTSGIVTIAQLDPIIVTFSLPQQQLSQVAAAMKRGVPRVVIAQADGGKKDAAGSPDVTPLVGTLDVIDNLVDQTTGTVRMKASFSNAHGRLWPGQYVALRVEIDTLRGVTTLPIEAVQRGPNGPFVYVVGAEDKITLQPLSLQREADGLAIITGLAADARVVTTGFSRLVEGGKVRVSQPDAPAKDNRTGEGKNKGPENKEQGNRGGKP